MIHANVPLKYIPFLFQTCRAAGCRTISEANAYLEQKRKKELEESMQKFKEAGASLKPQVQHKAINRPNMMKVGGAESEVGSPRSTILDAKKGSSTESPVGSTGAARSGWEDWDLTGLPGTDLLSVTVSNLQFFFSSFVYILIKSGITRCLLNFFYEKVLLFCAVCPLPWDEGYSDLRYCFGLTRNFLFLFI